MSTFVFFSLSAFVFRRVITLHSQKETNRKETFCIEVKSTKRDRLPITLRAIETRTLVICNYNVDAIARAI